MSDPRLSPEQDAKRRRLQRRRNIALGLALAALVLLFYIVTLVKGVPPANR